MVCLSADQFAENLYFDMEMDSGISGPLVASCPDEGMSTATTQGEISSCELVKILLSTEILARPFSPSVKPNV